VLVGCGSGNENLPEEARVDAAYSQPLTDWMNENVPAPKAEILDFKFWEEGDDGFAKVAYYSVKADGKVVVPLQGVDLAYFSVDGARFTFSDGEWKAYIGIDERNPNSIAEAEGSPSLYLSHDFIPILKRF
jgi:hypothetical protein